MNLEKRNCSIEVLRILSMFLIVISHFCVHGINNMHSSVFLNNIILNIFSLGNLGVVIFILITGYFSSEKDFKLNKIINLELSILFYSILFFIICSIYLNKSVINFELIKSFFPFLFKKYWFMTAYMSLYFLIPFINKFLNFLEKDENLMLVIFSVFFVFVIPTFTTSDLYFNELFQFITIYLVGAFIRKYYKFNTFNKLNTISLISMILILILSSLFINLFSFKFSFLSSYGDYFFNRNSIFILILAINILICFLNFNMKYNNFIIKYSSCMLGVYLIHDNPDVRYILWNNIFKITDFIDSYYLLFIIIFLAIILFVICVLIEKIRILIFGKINDNISKNIESVFYHIFLKIRRFFI